MDTTPLEHDAQPSDEQVDAASNASMDASDPPAFGGITGAGAPAQGDDHIARVQERAYELWQAAGCPADSDLEFWLKAEAELSEGDELER